MLETKAKWAGQLSTTEPFNNLGLIKVRQNNKGSETFEFQITENSQPFDLTGMDLYFNTKFNRFNPVQQRATIVDAKKGIIRYTLNDYDMQLSNPFQPAYFEFRIGDRYVGSTQTFFYHIVKSIYQECTDGSTYIIRLEELFKIFQDFFNTQSQDWLEFVEANREILESIDPGGMILTELIDSRHSSLTDIKYKQLKDRLYALDDEFRDNYVNVTWFGAEGDGVTDDTEAIQKAIDFVAFSVLNKHLRIFFPAGTYIVRRPILLYAKEHDVLANGQWWYGDAVSVFGAGKSRTKIIKIGEEVTENLEGELNGKDSTLIFCGLDAENNIIPAQKTGISISDISIFNHSKELESYAVRGTASQRATLDNMNIETLGKGIYFHDSFSSTFKNLVITCKQNALELTGGTSNSIDMVYSFGVRNPYILTSVYSNIGTLYADHATGTVFKLGGQSLHVNNLGSESPDADRILDIKGYVTIDNLFFHRLNTEQSPISLNGFLDIRLITVSEKVQLDASKKIALVTYSNENARAEYNLGNVRYSINNNVANPKYYLSTSIEDRPNAESISRVSFNGANVNFRRGNMQPFLGLRQGADLNLPENFKAKAVYLDNETIFSTSQENVEWQKAYETGDVLLMNNAKQNGVFASVVTEKTNEFVNGNKFKHVQIISNEQERPKVTEIGFQHFDRQLGKPIWWKGNGWYDANGTFV